MMTMMITETKMSGPKSHNTTPMTSAESSTYSCPPGKTRSSTVDDEEKVINDIKQEESAARRDSRKFILLPLEFTPTPYTVVCGRGYTKSVGNLRLHVTANMFVAKYSLATSRFEKSAIVTEIMDIFEAACPGGDKGGACAFVQFSKGRWWQVDSLAARERVGAVLRDLLHPKYKSSTKSKLKMRKSVKETTKKNRMRKSFDMVRNNPSFQFNPRPTLLVPSPAPTSTPKERTTSSRRTSSCPNKSSSEQVKKKEQQKKQQATATPPLPSSSMKTTTTSSMTIRVGDDDEEETTICRLTLDEQCFLPDFLESDAICRDIIDEELAGWDDIKTSIFLNE